MPHPPQITIPQTKSTLQTASGHVPENTLSRQILNALVGELCDGTLYEEVCEYADV